MALASTAMRRVLVSYARQHRASKRGGGDAGESPEVVSVDLDQVASFAPDRADEMLALDRALEKLSALSERLSQTVELRFFGGLTVEEIAELRDVAASTVKLDWQKAKAWLYRELHTDE
jgi:RNA polymerase sigma factor (TIGR02999 family)